MCEADITDGVPRREEISQVLHVNCFSFNALWPKKFIGNGSLVSR